MAEIASTYPTAGGLYYWSSKLGSPAWGWFTGWFNLIGLIGIIGAVGYGLAIYATAFFNLVWGYPNDKHHIFYLFAAFLAFALLVNIFDVRITSLINAISAYWHVIGVGIIVGACIFVPDHHQSASYVFTQTINNSGFSGHTWGVWPFALVFVIGSIGMAQYTLTGYDASAHMSEETHKASRSAAVGMLWSVIVSVIAGFILLVAITFAIPSQTRRAGAVHLHHDLHLADLDGHALGRGAALHRRVRAVLLPDRMRHLRLADAVRVLARPGRSRPQLVAVGLTPPRAGDRGRSVRASAAFLLLLPTWWNNLAGYYVGTSVGTTGLYIAFILPVILRLRAGSSFERGAWSLGKHYKWINWIAILWVAFISIVFMLPTAPAGIPGNANFTWNAVNYAPLTIGGAFILFGGWWVLSAKNWFKGPVRMGTDDELAALEAKQEGIFALPADTELA